MGCRFSPDSFVSTTPERNTRSHVAYPMIDHRAKGAENEWISSVRVRWSVATDRHQFRETARECRKSIGPNRFGRHEDITNSLPENVGRMRWHRSDSLSSLFLPQLLILLASALASKFIMPRNPHHNNRIDLALLSRQRGLEAL